MANVIKLNANQKSGIDVPVNENSFSGEWQKNQKTGTENISYAEYINYGNNYIQHRHNNKEKEKKEGFSDMDNNKILEKYIEKLDRDQSDLRKDIQASEQRTGKRLSEIEQRMDNRLNRIEDMISEQGNKINSLHNHVTQEFRDNRRFMWGIVISVAALVLTAIIGIVQIVMQK